MVKINGEELNIAGKTVAQYLLTTNYDPKRIAVAVTVIGAAGAIFLPLTDITDFLYFIGSVFAPMVAIQIADFFILNQNKETRAFSVQNLIIWFVGFVIYRLLMHVDIVVGNTLTRYAYHHSDLCSCQQNQK